MSLLDKNTIYSFKNRTSHVNKQNKKKPAIIICDYKNSLDVLPLCVDRYYVVSMGVTSYQNTFCTSAFQFVPSNAEKSPKNFMQTYEMI